MLTTTLLKLANVNEIPEEGGIAYLLPTNEQLAIFKIQGQIFVTQNECPHKKENVLARGIIGNKQEQFTIACPMHKKLFDLKTGNAIQHTCGNLKIYKVIIKNKEIFIEI